MKARARLLTMACLATVSLAHADMTNTTFRISGSNVEMVTTNTTDTPITVVSIKLLGTSQGGKPSPVLFALSPGTVINAKQQKTIVLGNVADIRRYSPRATEFERSKFCVGPIEPCLDGITNYESFNSGLGIEMQITSGPVTQDKLASMPIHFVIN